MYSSLVCVFLLGFSGYALGASNCTNRDVNSTEIVNLAQQVVQMLNSNETDFHRELTVVLGARSEQVDQSTVEYHLHLVNNVTMLQTTTVSLGQLFDNAQPLDEIQETITINATVVNGQEPTIAVLPKYEGCAVIYDL
ncbi:hypothetical protein DdX_18608 [Ditylenchus destructor]|uniref:Uncharacterized protein n=1 Tax=Ditylenchus destructor TaxID=166010 RepID=A0AAD4MKE4_9BILA|nr:hypothetical protein DdX_18608 [Ditylenchus destructor]